MTHEAPQFTKTEFRQIKYLLYFVIFIIIFQVFQYITTKRATKKYKDLFGQATEIVMLANSVSFETSNIHRSILNLSYCNDSAEIRTFRESLIKSEKAIAENIALIEDKIVQQNLYSFEKALYFAGLKVANQQYKARYERYLTMLQAVSGEDKLHYRRNVLRPALEAFQERQDKFMLRVFSDQQQTAEAIAEEADHTGFNLLLGGNVLLVLIALLLIYIIVSERKKVVSL